MDSDVPPLEIRAVLTRDGRTVVRIVGDLDAASRDHAWGVLRAAAQSADGDLAIEAAGIGFLDSSGIGVLVSTAKELGNGTLVLHSPTRQVRRVLEIAGLTDYFRILD